MKSLFLAFFLSLFIAGTALAGPGYRGHNRDGWYGYNRHDRGRHHHDRREEVLNRWGTRTYLHYEEPRYTRGPSYCEPVRFRSHGAVYTDNYIDNSFRRADWMIWGR